jgi:osmotically-inducible protein OsmY
MDDKALRKLVQDELDWQPSIDGADIGVTVENGIVHLTGHLPSYSQKLAVESAVKRVKGVRGYTEDLQVRLSPDTTSDEVIAGRVANLIDWDVSLAKETIKVKVEGGYVTLTGDVNWNYQRSAAEQGIRQLAGVRGLNNQIFVKPQVKATDIRRRIEDALERQAELEANKISVTVQGSKVMLDGKVRTWLERDIIERAAWAAPGVQTVEDRISIA